MLGFYDAAVSSRDLEHDHVADSPGPCCPNAYADQARYVGEPDDSRAKVVWRSGQDKRCGTVHDVEPDDGTTVTKAGPDYDGKREKLQKPDRCFPEIWKAMVGD